MAGPGKQLSAAPRPWAGHISGMLTNRLSAEPPASLAVPPALARALPQLAGLLPEWRLLPEASAPAGAPLLWLAGTPAPPGRAVVWVSQGPWVAPRFAASQGLVGLLLAAEGADPVASALAQPASEDASAEVVALAEALPTVRALLAAHPALPAAQAVARLLAASRFVDAFTGQPCAPAEALGQLLAWEQAAAENQGLHAATGMQVFKRGLMRQRLGGAPRFFWRGSAALRWAARRGGAVAVWAAAMPANLPARAAAAGVRLVQVEDGFLRSAGLGVLLAPAHSLVLDGWGMHFDPASASGLERLLAETAFSQALLERAARLRRALLQAGVSKYNLAGDAALPEAPPGRRRVLVVGQVEDDASLLRGGGVVRRNLDLLRAARAAHPDGWLLYRPHPDVVAGMRRGAVPAQALAGLADAEVAAVPLAPLYALVEEVWVMSSLAGFEALLRGRRVVCLGQPFYAGWGLTEDQAPLPRRQRRLGLDALVAGALILYPRYWDPVTGLPCPVEVFLARLAGMAPPPAPRLPAVLRRAVARASAWWTALGVRL